MGGVGPAVVVENQWCLHLMICQMGVALFIDALFLRNVLRRETEVSSELQSIVCLTSTLWMDGERRRMCYGIKDASDMCMWKSGGKGIW
jgi:hypothetical protein